MPRLKILKRSMTPQWTIPLNKKLISKERKPSKIKNFNSQNKEIKSTRITKLKPLKDMKKDSSKRRKKLTRLLMIELVECKLIRKVLIPSTNKREKHSKNLKRAFNFLKVKLKEKRLSKWKSMKILRDNRKNLSNHMKMRILSLEIRMINLTML